MEARIPLQKFAYINLDKEDIKDPEIKDVIKKSIEIINEFSVNESQSGPLEVVMLGKECPKCKARLLESIAISPKNNKPYHRIKCEKEECDYVSWVKVEAKS